MKRAIIMVFCLLVGIMALLGSACTTPLDYLDSCVSREVIIGWEDIRMPLGRILLVYKDAHYYAVKFTEAWTGKTIEDCFENYESYCLGDGTGNPFDKSVLCVKGQLVSRRILFDGGHLLPIPPIRPGPQHQDLKCGPIKLYWDMGNVYFGAPAYWKHCNYDYSMEFAPTKWTDISQVNVFDPRLTWYRYDENRKTIVIPIDQLWEDAGEQKKDSGRGDKRDYDKAIADYTKALEINPKDADAYNNRGNAWGKKRDYGKAIADYTKAIEIDPQQADYYYNRGLTWGDKGDYDKAIADYTKAIEINPKDADAYYNRGNAWYRKSDYDRAIADYTKAIELNPTYGLAYQKRGNAWGKKGKNGKSLDDYRKAEKIDPRL